MLGAWRIRQMLARRRLRRLTRAASRAVRNFPCVPARSRHALPQPLVVNVTSYPRRYPTLHLTLRSLLDQSVMPDRTILWLAQRDLAGLPAEVISLAGSGLEIRACEDLRSYKKLVPALQQFPEAFHVTADDDVYYPPGWLAGLVREAERGDRAILAWRAHMAHFETDGRLASYAGWEAATARTDPADGEALFPTGVGGVLYPPASLHPDVLDRSSFTGLCPAGDDIWFFWMARRQGTAHRRVQGWLDLIEWPGTQEAGLRVDNVRGGNDRQIRAMEATYGPLPHRDGPNVLPNGVVLPAPAESAPAGTGDISGVGRRGLD